jgi:hypothetical protein
MGVPLLSLSSVLVGVVLTVAAGGSEAATRRMCSTAADHCLIASKPYNAAPAAPVAKPATVVCSLRKIGGSWVLVPPPGHTVAECR